MPEETKSINSTLPPAPEIPKKKGAFFAEYRVPVITGIFFALILLGFLGYWLYTSKPWESNDGQPEESEEQDTSDQSEDTTGDDGDTEENDIQDDDQTDDSDDEGSPYTGWKTYTNADAGITFMYPPTWEVGEDTHGQAPDITYDIITNDEYSNSINFDIPSAHGPEACYYEDNNEYEEEAGIYYDNYEEVTDGEKTYRRSFMDNPLRYEVCMEESVHSHYSNWTGVAYVTYQFAEEDSAELLEIMDQILLSMDAV